VSGIATEIQADPGQFRRLHPLTPVAKGWKVVAIAGAATLAQLAGGGGEIGPWLWMALAAVPIAVVYGLMSWLFTRYAVIGGDLRVETGLVFRRSRLVDLERLQSVDVVQPLVPRILGLAELRLEVAGGSSTEAPLAYLTVPAAHQLRSELLAHHGVPVEERVAGANRPVVLAQVPVSWLVGSAALSGAWVASLVLAGLAVLDFVLTGGGVVFGLFLPAVIGAFRGARAFLGDYDFTVIESPEGLRIHKGLLDTRVQTVPRGRIQAVRITRPLLWRPFGWVRVSVTVAGYGGVRNDDEVRATSTLLPVAPAAIAHDLVRRVLPMFDLATPLSGAPRRARWVSPIGWSGLGTALTPVALITREGLMGRDLSAMPLTKPQSVRLTQGPLERRLRLATVHSDTTPGPVRVRAVNRADGEARELFDEVARRVAERLPRRREAAVTAATASMPSAAAGRDEPAVVREIDR
jgi:putative membrane protein